MTSFPGCRNWVSCQTHSLWLNNAVQCRHPTGRSSIAAAAWTHEGNLSNLWMPCVYISLRPRNPSWIWIRYIQYTTTGTTLCHPQNWLCRCDALFRSRHLALISPLGHFNGDNARLSHKSIRRTKLTVTPKFISSNGNMAFAKLRRTPSLARPTIRAVFSTLSHLHFVSILTTSPRGLQHKSKPNIPCCK